MSEPSLILAEFDANEKLYRDFGEELKRVVTEVLNAGKLQIHSVNCRVKERFKLQRKISSNSTKYGALKDVTDIAGVRITTFFSDDVDRISKIVEQEFEIDWENSIDKRATLDPDRFGYLSLHYVISLGASRARLPENLRYAGLKAEIQMRSILQHAWAEIEHDIGYKSELAVPREVRRRFSRLAGLLELADDEFVGIRDQLAKYEAEIPSEIEKAPESVSIDNVSLTAFIETSPRVRKLDQALAALCSAEINAEVHPVVLEGEVAVFDYLAIRTIADLDAILQTNESHIIAFAKSWLTTKQKSFVKGVCLLYLVYVLIGGREDLESIKTALDLSHVGLSTERAEIAERVKRTWRETA